DVRLLQLDILVALAGLLVVDPLVVVVHRDREDLLRAVLADHVLVEDLLDLRRLGDRARAVALVLLLDLLGDDVIAQPDALVADVDGGAGDQLLDLFLGLAAERAGQGSTVTLFDGHRSARAYRAVAAGTSRRGPDGRSPRQVGRMARCGQALHDFAQLPIQRTDPCRVMPTISRC